MLREEFLTSAEQAHAWRDRIADKIALAEWELAPQNADSRVED